MSAAPARSPHILRLRGKSFMSVVLTPDPPLDLWLGILDEQIARSPKVFEGRPVLLDVSAMVGQSALLVPLVEALTARGIRVIGIDGSMPHDLSGVEGQVPPVMSGGRNASVLGQPDPRRPGAAPIAAPEAAAPPPPPAAEPVSLVLDQSVRSGQSVTHTAGDVTVIGSVASGSEVIAGGSIHVYGTLRGRAIAGLLGGGANGGRPRIFCSRLSAELLAIDGVYKTADELDPALQGRAVQAWLAGDELMVAALD